MSIRKVLGVLILSSPFAAFLWCIGFEGSVVLLLGCLIIGLTTATGIWLINGD